MLHPNRLLLRACTCCWLILVTLSFTHAETAPSDSLRITAGSTLTHLFTTQVHAAGAVSTRVLDEQGQRTLRSAMSYHLKYAFRFGMSPEAARIYRNVYQGIGFSYYRMNRSEHIGNPLSVYLFQGATIARIDRATTLDYEWNLGVSAGWRPYNYVTNAGNLAIGSKVNALLALHFTLTRLLTEHIQLGAGISATHFSNGNTNVPNMGVNTLGGHISLTYLTRAGSEERTHPEALFIRQHFRPHFLLDMCTYGWWRRNGVFQEEERGIASPIKYPVVGVSLVPMYATTRKLKFGVGLDATLDSSAGLSIDEQGLFTTPSADHQWAVGLSLRGEWSMPLFNIHLGIGQNIAYGTPSLKMLYQIAALKVDLTHGLYAHIGYSLQDFKRPNFLMVGLGFRVPLTRHEE